ncbi:uncharacterized protein LOC100177447 isoform X1 [Ciona intestinalis]
MVCVHLDLVVAWNTSYQREDDHNILTIFLPILAAALVLCAGGCCYMEKKRKKRLREKAASAIEEDINDNESVVTTTSSRYRPYLLPSQTSGRSSLSRAGSVSSLYDRTSSYGEPPPYSGPGSRRSSIASTLKSETRRADSNRGRNISRSKSMMDVRQRQDYDYTPNPAPIRRSHSTTSLVDYRPMHHDGRYEDVSNPRVPSPTMSEWSIRTAPQMTSQENDYMVGGSVRSAASLPVSQQRSKMKRSSSQPNLLQHGIYAAKTYPQGILKRNAPSDDGRFIPRGGTMSSDSGIRDLHGDPEMLKRGSPSTFEDNSRPSTRPQSVYGSTSGRYDPYYRDNTTNDYPYARRSPPGYNDQGGVYSVSNSIPYTQHYGERDWGNNAGGSYPASYDPYSYSGNYWDMQGTRARVPHHGTQNNYVYGSMIY